MIKRFIHHQAGATAIEYALICACIFLVIVVSVRVLGNDSTGLFADTGQKVDGAMGHIR